LNDGAGEFFGHAPSLVFPAGRHRYTQQDSEPIQRTMSSHADCAW
jgi:hypothetical protein